jgi:hypothetical protein
MRQQVPEADVALAGSGELGQHPRRRRVEQDPAALDQSHQRRGEDWLGDRGEQKDRVGVTGPNASGRTVSAEVATASTQDGSAPVATPSATTV